MRAPWLEFEVPAGYDQPVVLTFEDINDRVPRGLVLFPDGTTFRYQAGGGSSGVNITYDSTAVNPNLIWYPEFRILQLDIARADTADVIRDINVNHIMEAFLPTGHHRKLFEGQLKVLTTRAL